MEAPMTYPLCDCLQRLLLDEHAATATEYAIMLVLILLVAFGTIIFLGQKVDQAFNKFVSMFNP
jgi:pilus assembly protein Flp/PilA